MYREGDKIYQNKNINRITVFNLRLRRRRPHELFPETKIRLHFRVSLYTRAENRYLNCFWMIMMMTKVSTHRSYDSSSSILNLNLFNFFDFSLFLLLLLLLALITSRGKQQLFNYFFGCRSFVSPMRKVETIWVVRMTRQTLREHKRKRERERERERERDFYWETRLSNLKKLFDFRPKISSRVVQSIFAPPCHPLHLLSNSVWQVWPIYCTLGNFSKPEATIILPKLRTF